MILSKTGSWLITGGFGLKKNVLGSTEIFEKVSGKNETITSGMCCIN